MRIGLHALGIGSGARPEIITAVAMAAERAGFATLWSGEHVVRVDRPDAPYPYSPDGRIAVAPDADWLDPLATLTFAAPVTSRIRLATGILLLPEHHPVLVAKQVATLDVLSGGRFVLGVGIGWSSEEFAVLGVPFAGRSRRTREYVEVMRVLWSDDPATYRGEFVSFVGVRCFPKPSSRRVPVVLGGNSDPALDRVAAYGDGWYGFSLEPGQVVERMGALAERCRERGRPAGSLDVSVSLAGGSPSDLVELAAAGVDEVVVVESPPDHVDEVGSWVRSLAVRWGVGPALPESPPYLPRS